MSTKKIKFSQILNSYPIVSQILNSYPIERVVKYCYNSDIE